MRTLALIGAILIPPLPELTGNAYAAKVGQRCGGPQALLAIRAYGAMLCPASAGRGRHFWQMHQGAPDSSLHCGKCRQASLWLRR